MSAMDQMMIGAGGGVPGVAGATWTVQYGSGSLFFNSISCSSTGQKVVAGTSNGSAYYSTNYGVSWSASSGGPSGSYEIAISRDGSTALSAGGGGLYKSTDGGVTWSAAGTPAGTYISCAISSDGNVMVAVKFGGYIYTSSDRGANWTARTGAGALDWYNVAMSSDGTVMYAVSTSNYAHKSTNSGATWSIMYSTSGGGTYGKIATSANGAVVALNNAGYGLLRLSTNSGSSFTNQAFDGYMGMGVSDDGKRIFVGSYTVCYVTDDTGAAWTARYPSGASDHWAMCCNADGSKAYAVTGSTSGYVYSSP